MRLCVLCFAPYLFGGRKYNTYSLIWRTWCDIRTFENVVRIRTFAKSFYPDHIFLWFQMFLCHSMSFMYPPSRAFEATIGGMSMKMFLAWPSRRFQISYLLMIFGSGFETGPVRSWSLIRIRLDTDLDLFDLIFLPRITSWFDRLAAQNRSGPVLIWSDLRSEMDLI